jgi:hypothetical protein
MDGIRSTPVPIEFCKFVSKDGTMKSAMASLMELLNTEIIPAMEKTKVFLSQYGIHTKVYEDSKMSMESYSSMKTEDKLFSYEFMHRMLSNSYIFEDMSAPKTQWIISEIDRVMGRQVLIGEIALAFLMAGCHVGFLSNSEIVIANRVIKRNNISLNNGN